MRRGHFVRYLGYRSSDKTRIRTWTRVRWKPSIYERGSSKSAHSWISIMFCMLNTYVITTTKMKLFHSSKAVRPQWCILMHTLFVLMYDLLNISLKSLTILTATFFKWNMKEDFPGYTLLPYMYMNTSRYLFLTHQNLNHPPPPYWPLKLVSIGDSVLIFTMFQFLSTHNIFRKVGQIHPLYAYKFS